jgi:Protein of unknown function (DUF1552)
MVIFKKSIPRRTFLRGMGASIALPLLDGMIPAMANSSETFQAPRRLATVFVPNGMWPMDKWTPAEEGTGFELSPTMEPLAPFRDRLLVLSGLAHKEAMPAAGDPTGEHMRATTTFLTGVRPTQTGGEAQAGISVDQIAARKLGEETQLASLEVSMMANHDLVGVCENNLSCLFVNTLSWKTPTTPLPMANNPRTVFERLFGDVDSTDREEQLARLRQQRSVLDGLIQRTSRLMNQTSAKDRAKLDEYLDAIRDIERRIQITEAQSDREIPRLERPGGVPAEFEDYFKLMVDLQVIAYQADLTRVITFMLAREGPSGGLAYPQIGIPDMHHNLSHHQNDPAKIDKLFRINQYHVKLFGYFLEKLQSVTEGEGTLLEHSAIIYGSSMSNGNGHQHDNLPILLAGGGNGHISGGRHLRYPDETPMTNLHLTLLDMLQIPVDELGDSTGELNLLSV